jgi:transposase-like protein
VRRRSCYGNTHESLPTEVRERAVRLVFDHSGEYGSHWEAISSIAGKIGCTAETLRRWVRQAERDGGARTGMTTEERERVRALEREVRELGQANEILRKASAYFAMAELDRPHHSASEMKN